MVSWSGALSEKHLLDLAMIFEPATPQTCSKPFITVLPNIILVQIWIALFLKSLFYLIIKIATPYFTFISCGPLQKEPQYHTTVRETRCSCRCLNKYNSMSLKMSFPDP